MMNAPNLTIADEELLAAEAIGRTVGALTVERIDSYGATFAALRSLVAAGNLQPICPELTNANPSAAHTVILETQAWLLAQMAYRINQVPQQNLVAFANLFGIEPRAATAAETILTFTILPVAVNVTVPAGTQISNADGEYVFITAEALTIPSGAQTGTASARRTVVGHTLLSPNVLTEMVDAIAFVESVANLSAIDSGTEAESLEATLNRVKTFQRRGKRIVSTQDLEDAILSEALNENGIVRAFPFIVSGDFAGTKKPGHTSVIVMTRAGEKIDASALQKISVLLDEIVGNQFIYIVSPVFVAFNIVVDVRLTGVAPSGAVVSGIERNLRNFYAPSREQFGRAVHRSEIIAIIEGTTGVDRIEADNLQILASPAADIKLTDYQLPKLAGVTINVV